MFSHGVFCYGGAGVYVTGFAKCVLGTTTIDYYLSLCVFHFELRKSSVGA